MICGPYGGVDAVLNVLLFVPFGFGLALAGLKARRAILIAAACTLAIELLQVRLVPGRDSSLGDILTNTLGAAVGFAAGRFRTSLWTPGPSAARYLFTGWIGAWLATQILVAYTFTPAFPAPPYYGQIDRPRGHSRPAFPGDVLAASVESLRVVRGGLPNASAIRSLLASREGAVLRVAATDGGIVSGKAELAVVSGPGMIAVASVEQDGESLVFGVRTGAERLRLRPYEFRLDSVFGEAQGPRGDILVAAARFTPGRVVMSATRGAVVRTREFVPRLSLGWIPFVPASTYIDGDVAELALSAVFLALLVLPAGFWAGHARNASAMRLPVIVGVLAVGIFAGLAIVPTVFRMRAATAWELACVLFGVSAGYALGRRGRAPPSLDGR